jgi:hypothetical protein
VDEEEDEKRRSGCEGKGREKEKLEGVQTRGGGGREGMVEEV